MKKLLLVVATAALGLGSLGSYADEVKLTDQDRMDLRQRVDTLRAGNAFGRTRDEGARGSVGSSDTTRVKAKQYKKNSRKHMKRGKAKARRS